MDHYLKYGSRTLKISVKHRKLLGILKEKKFKPKKSPAQLISDALGNKIEKFVRRDDRVGIVIPDNTRVAGVGIYLPIMLGKLKRIGIQEKDIIILIATGSHRPLNGKEIDELVGTKIRRAYRTVCNDAYDKKSFYYAGKTGAGTPIHINKEVQKVDKLIATSSVLYHYFAGYGGGPKILMPGLAGFESIAANHKRSLTKTGEFNKKCRSGNFKDNPVYSDIVESVKYFPKTLYLGTLLNDDGKIINAFCGNILETHRRAAKFLDRIYNVKIKQKADIVICSTGGYPKDINLIQSHKSIHNAFSAVKKGGIIICFAECRDGIGSKTFLDFFKYKTIDELKNNILKNYSLNAQTALSFWEKMETVRIMMVSELSPRESIHLIENNLILSPSYSNIKKYLQQCGKFTYFFIPSANSLHFSE